MAVGKSSEDVFALLGMFIALQEYQLTLVTHECWEDLALLCRYRHITHFQVTEPRRAGWTYKNYLWHSALSAVVYRIGARGDGLFARGWYDVCFGLQCCSQCEGCRKYQLVTS